MLIKAVRIKTISYYIAGLLRDQGEKSINFFFHNGSFKRKSNKVWYSQAQIVTLPVMLANLGRAPPPAPQLQTWAPTPHKGLTYSMGDRPLYLVRSFQGFLLKGPTRITIRAKIRV